MDSFKTSVEASLVNLGVESLSLLRRCDLLNALAQRLLIEEATKKIALSEDKILEGLKNHCRQEQLQDEAALKAWLEGHLMSREELLNQTNLPFKLSLLANEWFGAQSERRFLERKETLDQITYSLLRVKSSGLAHELYLQLEAGEANFENLAKNYSEGPEKSSFGKVGPGSLMRAHPTLRKVLRTAKKGVVQEPMLIEQWWIVTRLEERHEAVFNDSMQQQMTKEMLHDWLQAETASVIQLLVNHQDLGLSSNS